MTLLHPFGINGELRFPRVWGRAHSAVALRPVFEGTRMSNAHEFPASNPTSVAGPTLGWALRRAGLGLMILAVTVTAAACLLYAGIEPDRADASEQVARQTTTTSTGSLPAR